ncbi:DUF222 domain-containing protein [Gordonia hirsuta]|nr:DUF222 domain-containing protein [Gordonia hirsuta]
MTHAESAPPPNADRWERVDFSPAGMTAPERTEDTAEALAWMVYAAGAQQGQSYLYWVQLKAIGEYLDIALAEVAEAVSDGQDQRTLFDPYTVTIAEIGALFAVPQRRASQLLAQAESASQRLSKTAELLRKGSISPEIFTTVVDRTDIVVDRELIDAIDDDLSEGLSGAGHISAKNAEKIADRVVAQHDADAVRRRREKARRRKNVTYRDYAEGMAGISISGDAEEIRLAYEANEDLARAVCPNDPRTLGQRRSAAALAGLRRLPFTCGCPDKSTCTAQLDDAAISERQARIVVHAICQKSTLEGLDEEPAHLDGHGPIDADHVRDLARRPDAIVRDLNLDDLTATADDPGDRQNPATHQGPAAHQEPATDHAPAADPAPDQQQKSEASETDGDSSPHGRAKPACEHPRPDNFTDPSNEHPREDAHPDQANQEDQEDQESHPRETVELDAQSNNRHAESGHRHPAKKRLTRTALPSDPYRPTAALDALIRGLFPTCTVPGCPRPSYRCELDHVEEFNQICPASGGPTCICNISPKCKFHHLLKTHLGARRPEDGWVDDQWWNEDGELWTGVTLSFGITVETRAANQWLFPQLAGLCCSHQGPAPPANPGPAPPDHPQAGGRSAGGGLQATTEYKHAWRRAQRARLAADRRRIDREGGPPPF